jgi:chromosome segregation ATPase
VWLSEIATAFKQLQSEKRALEVIVRETTPLAGINDGEGLGRYLSTMSQKLELSSAEIRKLLDLLDQQRTVMDYMLDTHQLELDTADDDNDDLRDALAVALEHAETHEDSARRLGEELEQANLAAQSARTDAQKVRTRLADEENQRERAVTLLRAARDELQKAERERKEAQQRHLNSEQEASHARSMLSSLQEQLTLATNRLDSDTVQRNLSNVGLRDELEEEHAQHIKELTEEHETQYSELQERLAAAEKELDKARVAGYTEGAKVIDPRDEQIKAQAAQLERVYDEMADAMSDNVLARKRIAELEDQIRGRGDIGLLKRQFLEAQQRHEARSNELHKQLKEAQRAHEISRADMQKTLQLTSFVNGADGQTAKQLVVARRQHDEARAAQKQAEQDLQKALADLNALKEAAASQADASKRADEKDVGDTSTSSSPPNDGAAQRLAEVERERDDMLRRMQQQEKDIAELRAAIALSANSPSELKTSDPLQRSANVGRETQVSALMTQLAEQRARETQIRSAYKQARDELRKIQSAQSSDRKRHNASLSYLAGATGIPHSGSMSSMDAASPSTSYAPSSRSSTINGSGKKLKRLSLPLAAHPASPGFASTAEGFSLRPDTASGAIGGGRFNRAPSTELGHGIGQDSPKSLSSVDGRGESWGSSSSAVAEQDHEDEEELSP